ncbi:MAG: hypothetical protein ACYC6V_02855 [Bacillota bacterium]
MGQLLEAFWLTRHRWPEKAKYAREAAQSVEPATAALLQRLATAHCDGGPGGEFQELVAAATEAAEAVLIGAGRLLRESWALPPEDVFDAGP